MNNNETALVLDYKELPAYKGAKERQQTILEHNPFVIIVDNKTYKIAKQRRTALRQGRYDLQNGEKLIASKLNDFRAIVKNETEQLINITIDAENKQQSEIERYESEKQREKEEAIKKEQERKAALMAQINAFKISKQSAIESSTIKTIDSIFSDIESAELQVEEFSEVFQNLKADLIISAQKRKNLLVEDERLKTERKAQEEERKRLEEERKALEAERKAQEEEIRKLREANEQKLRTERMAEENRLKAEREKIESEKAAMAKAEAERKEREEAELKAKREEMIKQRIKKVVELGWSFNEITNEFTFGKLVCEKWEIETMDDETFETSTLSFFRESLNKENARIEALKPDRQKLTELVEKFDTSQFVIELQTNEARVLLTEFLHHLNNARNSFLELIKEL